MVTAKYQKPATCPHLVALYETSKQREEHGRLRGFGVLSEVLHHRAVCLLEGVGQQHEIYI